MVEFLADFLFALEAVEENRVGFHFRVRDFDGDGLPVAHVGGRENGGHAAAGDKAVDAVVIELIAGVESIHCGTESAVKDQWQQAALVQLIGPSPIHTHAFDIPDADQLNADIIVAAPFIGKRDQFLRGAMQVLAVAAERSHFGSSPPSRAIRRSTAGERPRETSDDRLVSTFTISSVPSERLRRCRVGDCPRPPRAETSPSRTCSLATV